MSARFFFVFAAIVFSSLFWGSPLVLAQDDCSPIDLNQRMPGSNRPVLPRSIEQSAGFCYAHAAAQLLSFATRQEVSPLGLALLNNAVDPIPGRHVFPEGGSTPWNIEQAVSRGSVLSESCLPSASQEHVELFDAIYRGEINSSRAALAMTNNQCIRVQSHAQRQMSLSQSLLKKTGENLYHAARIQCEFKSEGMIATQNHSVCNQRVRNPRNGFMGSQADRRFTSVQNQLASTISQILTAQRPVALTYNSAFSLSGERGELHAVVITGRKKINGTCHFVVKNSWGSRPCAHGEPPGGFCGHPHAPADSFTIPVSQIGAQAYEVSFIPTVAATRGQVRTAQVDLTHWACSR